MFKINEKKNKQMLTMHISNGGVCGNVKICNLRQTPAGADL